MPFKTGFAAILFATAGAAFAQAAAPAPTARPAASPAEAALHQSARALGQCVSAGMQGIAASVAPPAAAAQVMGGCASQRQQLVLSAQALIATMPADQRAIAEAQLQSQLTGAEASIATEITRRRNTPSAAPAGR